MSTCFSNLDSWSAIKPNPLTKTIVRGWASAETCMLYTEILRKLQKHGQSLNVQVTWRSAPSVHAVQKKPVHCGRVWPLNSMVELLCAHCQTQVAIGRKCNLSGLWPSSQPHFCLTFLWTGFENARFSTRGNQLWCWLMACTPVRGAMCFVTSGLGKELSFSGVRKMSIWRCAPAWANTILLRASDTSEKNWGTHC